MTTNTWAVTDIEHRAPAGHHCPDCLDLAETAIDQAREDGLKHFTLIRGGHGCTITRVFAAHTAETHFLETAL